MWLELVFHSKGEREKERERERERDLRQKAIGRGGQREEMVYDEEPWFLLQKT